MTKLLASTALVAMLAAPAMAQTATDATTAPATTDAPMTTEGTTAAPADATATTTMPAEGAAGEMGFGYTAMAGDMSAETFIGKRLYASEADVDMNATFNEVDENWEDIGEISDLVISQDGQVKAVLTDIGGFLGLGERTVAVSMDQLRVIRDGDSEDEYFIVFTANREALENAPEFEWVDE
ncbi:PRC-barrel domain-containing protein [Paracoccus sp. WLY502]|uniref:PRC-barrel domain-containing protein n=1 Tax=Paracoccus yibinensis TaxID=3068891 RepID=UPI0027967DED|nr:PRC-barrel domain-containing protein [Paracoccus sp. WLY502]MDQ1900539.1 PRC-barrel domain-containing protein [Paracoccus sp. WLY502]